MERFFVELCKEIFGENFDLNLLERAVRDTNLNYGGLSYDGSRVVFINGSFDPWYS